MKRSIFELETDPLTREQILIMRAATWNIDGRFEHVANYLFTMIPNPVRKDRSDSLASIECDASMLPKLKKLATRFADDIPFNVVIEDDKTVLRAEGDWAIVLNALLDAHSLPENVLQAAESVVDIYGFEPFFSKGFSAELFMKSPSDLEEDWDLSCDDTSELFPHEDVKESLKFLREQLDILKIPHKVTEQVLVAKSKLKAKGEIVMNKKKWRKMKAKFTSPVKLIEEVDSLVGL